jgi:hypothetical protein
VLEKLQEQFPLGGDVEHGTGSCQFRADRRIYIAVFSHAFIASGVEVSIM